MCIVTAWIIECCIIGPDTKRGQLEFRVELAEQLLKKFNQNLLKREKSDLNMSNSSDKHTPKRSRLSDSFTVSCSGDSDHTLLSSKNKQRKCQGINSADICDSSRTRTYCLECDVLMCHQCFWNHL